MSHLPSLPLSQIQNVTRKCQYNQKKIYPPIYLKSVAKRRFRETQEVYIILYYYIYYYYYYYSYLVMLLSITFRITLKVILGYIAQNT